MANDLDPVDELRAKFNKHAAVKRSSRNILGTVFDFYHGLNGRDGWIDVVGRGPRSGPWKPKEMSDAQIRRALLKAYKDGWENIYFVKGGKIDSQTTQRAERILKYEMPGLRGRRQSESQTRQKDVSDKIQEIQAQMRSTQKELQDLHAAGKGQSDEAKAVMQRMDRTQTDLNSVVGYYQRGEWQRGFRIGTSLPEEAFNHLNAFQKIPALKLGPITLAMPFTHAAAFQKQVRDGEKAERRAGWAEWRQSFGT